MKKKEFAVGEVFQLGLFKLKVTEGPDCCGCFFAQNHITNCVKTVGPCNPNSRDDKISVIFTEVEEEE